MARAKWEEYERYLENFESGPLEGAPVEEIDRRIRDITKKLQEADDKYIPVTRYRTIPAPCWTDEIRNNMAELRQLYNDIRSRGSDYQRFYRQRQLRDATSDLI